MRLVEPTEPAPVLPFIRVRQLTIPQGPFSKSYVLKLIREGKLRAKRVGKVVLIDAASVRELLDNAPDYRA